MKLISKSIIYYLLISLPLLVVACLVSYYLLKDELSEGTDKILKHEKRNAKHLINSFQVSDTTVLFPDSLFKIEKVPFHKNQTFYSDTVIYNKAEKEPVAYRALKSYYNKNQSTYLISILRPALEEHELMEGLVSSLFVVIGFLLFSFLIVNWILSKWLWRPFYHTISSLNKYELKKDAQFNLAPSNTKEFKELNKALLKMTDKVYADFMSQKEFTENASHEIQTPLAVIKSKLELLIQSDNLKEEEMQQIQIIETAVNKLSAINRALLLLVKIENHQFTESEDIHVQPTLEKILSYYQDIIADKNIQVERKFESDLVIKANPQLLDILLTNLLQNAIRHNIKNGIINIEVNNKNLIISNTGSAVKLKEDEIFERFKKDTQVQESLGIGLAIVRSIAKSYKINIAYVYQNDKHVFKLELPLDSK